MGHGRALWAISRLGSDTCQLTPSIIVIQFLVSKYQRRREWRSASQKWRKAGALLFCDCGSVGAYPVATLRLTVTGEQRI
jgi:hypothetical protein